MSNGARLPQFTPGPRPHDGSSSSENGTRLRWLLGLRRVRAVAVGALALLGAGYALARPLAGGGESPASVDAVLFADGADTVPLFGPRRMDALSGGTAVYVESFVVRTTYTGYTLRVENGATDGTGQVDTATVRLNGVDVLTPADFRGGASVLEEAVQLVTDNTLEIEIYPGSGHLTLSLLATPDPTYTIHGPAVVEKLQSGMTTYADSFALPVGAAPPYRLHVVNGTPDDSTARIAQGHIELNGTEVLTPSDLNDGVGAVVQEVGLLSMNQFEVVIQAGQIGDQLTVRFTATDTTAPAVDITAPAEGAVVGDVEVFVSGTLLDQTATSVVVNGGAAAVTNNQSFSATVPLGTEGEHWIVATATDAAGNEARDSVQVVRDTQAPILTLTAPADGLVTGADSVDVVGSVQDATETTLSVNGLPVPVDGAGGFSAKVAVAEGQNVITTTATDAGGNSTSDVRLVTGDRTPPALTVTEPADSTTTPNESIFVAGTVFDSTAVAVTANGTPLPAGGDGSFGGDVPLTDGENTITTVATDAAGNQATDVRTVVRELPPDPSTVAPPVDSTVVTALHTVTEFLYTGPEPIQTGVAPGTIEPTRVAVFRGRVLTRDGGPLPGVTVTVLGHAELGQTISRLDGAYDLAVNGGGLLTLDFQKGGYLPAQRPVEAPWQEYADVKDVALVQLDTVVTVIDLSDTTTLQVARGSVVTDADGPRQGTLLFEPGTEAVMVLPDGTEQALTSLSVRATEYTMGENGPKSMPADLPPTVAYTYAVELSADEAVAAGARSVRFTEPVPFYVENFLSFPVGLAVPVGIYDPERGVWVPERNGRIIEIVGDSTGVAEIDTNGDGAAEDSAGLAALGISAGERGRLAALYAPGDSLWRVELGHFSAIDLNYAPTKCGAPACVDPGGKDPKTDDSLNEPCEDGGSVIECENQTLGERIGVSGTPFTLNYRSDRAPGRKAAYTLHVPLSGAVAPDSLRRILFEVRVAGRTFRDTFPADPNQEATFTWDGIDAYGRKLQGSQPAVVRVGYVYPFYYSVPAATAKSFGLSCTGSGTWQNCVIPQDVITDARKEEERWKEWQIRLGPWDARAQALGGWTLDVHHAYDPWGLVLYRGDGGRRSATNMNAIITRYAGTTTGYSGDGGLATEAKLWGPLGLATGADGSLYIGDQANHRVRRVGPDEIITTVVGTGEQCLADSYGSCGDGGPAIAAKLDGTQALAVGPDGSLYIVESGLHRVRRVRPDGIITLFAGNGTAGFSGDGGPATAARLFSPSGVAVGPGGSVYIGDTGNGRVRRVGPDGIITTIAGNGGSAYNGDGQLATRAALEGPRGLAVGPDGSLYIADDSGARIRRVRPDGRIATVAGNGVREHSGDGGPAVEAGIDGPTDVAVGPDGSIYIAVPVLSRVRVRRVGPDGIITTAAGTGEQACGRGCLGPDGDGGPATAAMLYHPWNIALGPDGSLYIAETTADRVRRVGQVLPGLTNLDPVVISEDGTELYHFEASGRHLRTLDALTGTVRYEFGYNAAGHLVSVTDADGLVTTIERDPSGVATAIVAPFGQRTELVPDANGYLARVANPAGDSVRLAYHPDGLLASFTGPRGHASSFVYDSLGYLLRDVDAAGGFKAVTRTESEAGHEVAVRTALGRLTTYAIEELSVGGLRRTVTGPAGLTTSSTIRTDGTRTTIFPDGTVTNVTESPDPRFGMQAPVVSRLNVATPGGRSFTMTQTRRVTLSDPADPLSLSSQTDTVRVNGRVYATHYDASLDRIRTTTPQGRVALAWIDSVGRTTAEHVSGIDTIHYSYDGSGRLEEVVQGGRAWSFAYDAAGLLSGITDPLLRRDSLFYDPAGRLERQVLPDGREITYEYDAAGNLTSLTPPGRTAHTFTYNAVGLLETYTAPDAGEGPTTTTYSYDLDRRLDEILRPDSQAVQLSYDSAGRVDTLTIPRGPVAFAYDGVTGNLKSVVSPTGDSLVYGYDGSLVTEERWTGTVAGSVGFGYDNDFRVREVLVNGADTVSFQHDGDGLLTGAGALTITRDPGNGVLSGTLLDSLTTAHAYNSFGELRADTVRYRGQVLFARSYTRDALGRIEEVLETVDSVTTRYTYLYGPADRIVEVLRDSVSAASYEYDQNGNRELAVYPMGTLVGTYDAQDRLTSYGDATYTYTANGELRTKVVGTDTTRYTYDVLGNLMRAELPDGTVVEYVIDGRNRRVGKKVNGTLVQGFLYSGQLSPVAELDSTGAVVARFVYGTKANVPDFMEKGGTTYRILTDHLGSVRLVVDVLTGAVVQRLDYDAFGQVTTDTNRGFQPFGFAGGLYDTHTGLVRFGARDYDAYTGRWTAKDPIGFGGGDANLYVYGINDSINYVDIDGLCYRDVYALRGGKIFRAGYQEKTDPNAGLGFRTSIMSEDATTYDQYGHMEPGSAPPPGTIVRPGDYIGRYADPTNGRSSGPHVHHERRSATTGEIVDPGSESPLMGGTMTSEYGDVDSMHSKAHQGNDWIGDPASSECPCSGATS